MEHTESALDESKQIDDYKNIYKVPDTQSSPFMIASNTSSQPKFLKVNDFSTTVDLDKKNDFVKELDCTQFTSSEITVKVIGRDIIVKAEQEEQHNDGNGPSSLNTGFYNVSDLYDLEKVKALLGLDKVLTLYAPRKDKKAVDKESPSDI